MKPTPSERPKSAAQNRAKNELRACWPILLTLILLFFQLSPVGLVRQAQAGPTYAATSTYHRYQIAGWTVLFSDELITQHRDVANRVVTLMNTKLTEIARLLPPPAVRALRRVPFWMEWNDPIQPGGAYHPDKGWLEKHGLNPEMAHGIEFANALNLLNWSTHNQPMMVLHELAHAYHHQILDFNNPQIHQLYLQAKASAKYARVAYNLGPPRPAYAMNDQYEYFAESTEAFYGRNDFYPFVRSELKGFDPAMYALLERVWQRP